MIHNKHHDIMAWWENYLIKTLNYKKKNIRESHDNISLAENINNRSILFIFVAQISNLHIVLCCVVDILLLCFDGFL